MAQKTVRIGEWVPDLYSTQEEVITDLRNLIPGVDGYRGVKSFKPITEPIPGFDAGNVPQGTATFIQPDKSLITVVGTRDSLFIYEYGGTWTDVSRDLGYVSESTSWKFALFGDLLIATNYEDPVQCMNLKTDEKFHDLSDSAPRAKDLAVVGEFLVLINTVDQYDGERPQRVWWSPIGDPQGSWVPNQTTMCDYQDIFTGSYLTGIEGGEDGLLLLRNAIVRMTFIGSPLVFQFQTITNDYGNVGFNTYTSIEGNVFFLSDSGFKMFSGGVIEPIGLGKVDNYVRGDTLGLTLAESIAGVDIINNCVWWAYRDKSKYDDSTIKHNATTKALVYHYPSKRWGNVVTTILSFSNVQTKGYTLDELDEVSRRVDDLPFPLDSEAWRGGLPVLSGFSSDGRFGYFYGPLYSAELSTGKIPLQGGSRRSFVKRVRPLVDRGPYDIELAVAGTQEEQDENKFSGFITKSRAGDYPFRSSGRYHSLKMKISGTWNKIVGFSFDYDDAGEF